MLPETALFANVIHSSTGSRNDDICFDMKSSLLLGAEQPTQPPEHFDPLFIRSKRYFGKYKVFWWFKGEPLCALGPQWPWLLLNMSITLILGLCVFLFIAREISPLIELATLIFILCELAMCLYMAFKNPGICTNKNPMDPSITELVKHNRFCPKCKIIKEHSVIVHCKVCDVCIKGFHHHCSWIGKCVGSGNKTAFYLFLTLTVAYLFFCFGLTIFQIVKNNTTFVS